MCIYVFRCVLCHNLKDYNFRLTQVFAEGPWSGFWHNTMWLSPWEVNDLLLKRFIYLIALLCVTSVTTIRLQCHLVGLIDIIKVNEGKEKGKLKLNTRCRGKITNVIFFFIDQHHGALNIEIFCISVWISNLKHRKPQAKKLKESYTLVLKEYTCRRPLPRNLLNKVLCEPRLLKEVTSKLRPN